jgi:hypothetical protein
MKDSEDISKMICDCGLLIQPQYCREVVEKEELITKLFPKCSSKGCKDLPSFLNNLCGCTYCSKCIKNFIHNIKKSKDFNIADVLCVCGKEYDYSLFMKVKSKYDVMPKCCVKSCSNKAQLKNYFWCNCFFCLECLRKHLDKYLVNPFKYKSIKCLGCKEGLSHLCIPFAGWKYNKLAKSKENKDEYKKWIEENSSKVEEYEKKDEKNDDDNEEEEEEEEEED